MADIEHMGHAEVVKIGNKKTEAGDDALDPSKIPPVWSTQSNTSLLTSGLL